MQYAKLIKHPLPPVLPEYLPFAKENNARTLYHAEILDGVLAVTIFCVNGKKITLDFRHFYDGEKYATQRASDNKRLSGALKYYEVYCGESVDNADEIILDYVKNTVNKKTFDNGRCNPGIYTLYHIEQDMLKKALELRYKKITDPIDERMAILSEKPPQEFYDWVEDWVFRKARYFFYNYRKGKTQIGFCSHCKATFEQSDVKFNREVQCPSCGSTLICKPLGKVSKTIGDHACAAYIEETTENGVPTLVERIFSVSQLLQGYHNGAVNVQTRTSYYEISRKFISTKLFLPKKDKTGQVSDYVYEEFRHLGKIRWCPFNWNISRDTYIFPGNLDGIFKKCDIPEIQNIEASAITPHCKINLIGLAFRLRRMPALENFAKLGFYKLMDGLLEHFDFRYDDEKYHYVGILEKSIKTGCTSVYETLGIPKDVMNKLGNISIEEYSLYKKLEEIAPVKTDTFLRYLKLGAAESNNARDVITFLNKYKFTPEKFVGYLEKQCFLYKGLINEILPIYWDYLSMAKDLKLPKTESVLFPRNVTVEHDRLMKINTDRKYKKQDVKLKKRAKILEMLDFETDQFLIRPLRNSFEFLKESSVLDHCVKTYIDRCANGEINIYGIRKKENPDTPFFTLTLSNKGEVVVNLGKNNCNAPDDVNKFVKCWVKEVVAKKKKEFIEAANDKPQKVRITA